MKQTPLFLSAPLHEKIWGGDHLKDYGFDLPNDKIGEAWIVSAHDHGSSTIQNGDLKGKSLVEVWEANPELFGGHPKGQAFPLLVKILDANKDLSIQVHPDDTYAREHGEKYGKTESWYILSAKPDAKLYFGHIAQTKSEFQTAIDQGHLDEKLRTIPVKAGEFYYVPAGTLHALGAGIVALETQQSSDMTFRFYDFDRVDEKTGQKRDLQIEQALDVTKIPHVDYHNETSTKLVENGQITNLVDEKYFAVNKLSIKGISHLENVAPYQIMTVIEGSGSLIVNDEKYSIEKGMSWILPNSIQNYELAGTMTLIASHENR